MFPELDWQKCKEIFHVDGSLRDIYVHNVTSDDWNALFEFTSPLSPRFSIAGEVTKPPRTKQKLFELQSRHTLHLEFKVAGFKLCCNFFLEEQIELYFDPKDIYSETIFHALLEFMAGLGGRLGKDVFLTEENSEDMVLLRYKHLSSEMEFIDH